MVIVFYNGQANYIIPGQIESALAFTDGRSKSEMLVTQNQFPAYEFDKVADAVNKLPKLNDDEYGSYGIDLTNESTSTGLTFKSIAIIISMGIGLLCISLLVAKQIYVFRNRNKCNVN